MARLLERLTAAKIKNMDRQGMHPDGGGLYLQIKKGGKSWVLRYRAFGKTRYMGLGSAQEISLEQARQAAAEWKRIKNSGTDPLRARKQATDEKKRDIARTITFKQYAQKYIDAKKGGWRNAKHRQQWANTLETYAYPVMGHTPIQDVDNELVLKVLEPIWASKIATATRVRGRIEAILSSAKAAGYRQGENPARWKDHLEHQLAWPSKIAKPEHHAAVPYLKLGELTAQLRDTEGATARALELLILTATRTSELLGAKWDEFDLEEAVWIIPAYRTKADRKHTVPLPTRAVKVLAALQKTRQGDLVFPGRRAGKPLSNMAMAMLLRRIGCGDATVHGFRSTFRDWAAECTPYPREVMEAALAHKVAGETEGAYWRSDLFEKRKLLMRDWGRFCGRIFYGGSKPIFRSVLLHPYKNIEQFQEHTAI